MVDAFCNGYGCTVGIVVGICRIEVVGLHAFQAFGNGDISFAGRNSGNRSDRLCALGCLCGDSAAVNVYGNGAVGGTHHNPYGRLADT